MPKKMSCDGCFFQICCRYDRALKCLTNNYALRVESSGKPVGHAEAFEKEGFDEETNSREAPIWKMEGENPG